jgi:SAM-dependent methyltransferase
MKAVAAPGGISERFLSLLDEERLAERCVLDVGTGSGRLAFRLAPACRRVVGLDRDPGLIAQARRRAEALAAANAEFHVADVEREEYGRFAPDLVTAHLCVSDAVIERASRALHRGDCLAMVAFHVDQWRESGQVSRFAYDEGAMRRTLEALAFDVEALEVDRHERRFGTAAQALRAVADLEARWRADGRWPRYVDFLAAGGRTLTRSHLIVKARRR